MKSAEPYRAGLRVMKLLQKTPTGELKVVHEVKQKVGRGNFYPKHTGIGHLLSTKYP